MKYLTAIAVLVFIINVVYGLPRSILIGGLFDQSNGEQELAFRYAIQQVNNNPDILPMTRLEADVEYVPQHDSFDTSKKVCQMFRNGVAAIFGPSSLSTVAHIRSMCKALDIPHIETCWKVRSQGENYSLNLHPNPLQMSQVYWDIISNKGWKSFTILYEDEDELVGFQNVLQASTLAGYRVVIRRLISEDSYRPMFEEMKKMGETNVVISCAVESIRPILLQAQQVGWTTASHSFFITNLDLHTINVEDLRDDGVQIIGLRMVDPSVGREESLPTEAALISDAVQLLGRALDQLVGEEEFAVKSLSCQGSDKWMFGTSLINAMKQVSNQETGNWLTGPLRLDDHGQRTRFHLNILEFQNGKFSTTGTWDPTRGADVSKWHSVVRRQAVNPIRNVTVIVTSILSPPYFMMRESKTPLEGNDRFEGFVVDIMEEISKIVEFRYVFKLVDDASYGHPDSTGQWNGMIGELIVGKADMAIGDLSISYQREAVVDFTTPFMNSGIGILYKKPTKTGPNLFAFLTPLSLELWIYIGVAFLGVSLLLYLLARMTPYEWNNPHSCQQNPEILENRLTFCNSLWFTIGSLMLQGSDVPPKAISTRVIAGVWWFFALFMVSFYTANLVVLLSADRSESSPITSAEELAKQTVIQYGTVRTGSTLEFFKNTKIPTYASMYSFMMSTSPSPFTKNTMECVERVQQSKGRYACLMDSSSIEYFTKRMCDLTQIGGLLDIKGYAIALRPGSPYREYLNQAVLRLQKNEVLVHLKDKWWNHQRGGDSCPVEEKIQHRGSIALEDVMGIFAILIAGIVVALLICLCECIWHSRKSALRNGEGNVWNEMRKHLRHAFNCTTNTKPAP